MLVGYEPNHAGDCYRMWYPPTNKVVLTRDVIWLHRMYFPPKKQKVLTTTMAKQDGKGKPGDPIIELEVEVDQPGPNDDDVSQLAGTDSAMEAAINHQVANITNEETQDDTEEHKEDKEDDRAVQDQIPELEIDFVHNQDEDDVRKDKVRMTWQHVI